MSKINVVKMVGDLRYLSVFFVARSSCLFQISRRIRIIKLHVNVCVLEFWMCGLSTQRRGAKRFQIRSGPQKKSQQPHRMGTAWGPPLQFGFLITYGIWADRVVGYTQLYPFATRVTCRFYMVLPGICHYLVMHRIAPSTRWHHLVEQPWHLGVFIVAYAYTHLGKGETWGTVSQITASGCWLKLSRKGELHRYIHHKWSDFAGCSAIHVYPRNVRTLYQGGKPITARCNTRLNKHVA